MKLSIDHWYVAGLEGNRGMTGLELSSVLAETVPQSKIILNEQVVEAYQAALNDASKGDRILILGSFLTVEAVMRFTLDLK